jgi:hypothetical protein
MNAVQLKPKAYARNKSLSARSPQVGERDGSARKSNLNRAETSELQSLSAIHYAGPALSMAGTSGDAASDGESGTTGTVQFKLAINQPGDYYEREADAASDRVTSGGTVQTLTPLRPSALSRMATVQYQVDEEADEETSQEDERDELVQRCACDEELPGSADPPQIQRQTSEPCEDCEEKKNDSEAVQRQEEADEEKSESPELQTAPEGPSVPSGNSSNSLSGGGGSSVTSNLSHSGSGSPISPAVRQTLEPGLNADLTNVRVHNDGSSHQMARTLKARAFTHGQDIWLGAGESPHDTRLMAHEATHVMQQTNGDHGVQMIQRAPAEYRHPEDGGGVRNRLNQRFEEVEEDGEERTPAEARREVNQIDRGELADKKGELQGETRPDVDRPAQEGPEIDRSASEVEREAESPPEKLVEGEGEEQPKQEDTVGQEAMVAAQQAAGMAQQAYAVAESQPEPGAQGQVQPPEPVTPVDSQGTPLEPDLEADAAAVDLADRVQFLREQGNLMVARGAEGHANAEIVRGNIARVSSEVSKAEEGIERSQAHASYRHEVIGQAEQALNVSREKQATVAAGTPEYQSKADEGKEDTGPMRSEASGMAAENAANTPDDEEAAQKSREQGGKINQVGENSATMDDAVTQTRNRADSLVEDAARAAELNNQTKTQIGDGQQKLAQTDQRLSQMEAQASQARGQVAGLQSAPDDMHAQAAQLEEQGQEMIRSSFELEEELHDTQSGYATSMSAVPPLKYLEPEESEEGEETVSTPTTMMETASTPSSGEETLTGGEAAGLETGGVEEGMIQTLPDERLESESEAKTTSPREEALAAATTTAPTASTAERETGAGGEIPAGSEAASIEEEATGGGAPLSSIPGAPAVTLTEGVIASGVAPGAETQAAAQQEAAAEEAQEEPPAGETAEGEPSTAGAEAEPAADAQAGPASAAGALAEGLTIGPRRERVDLSYLMASAEEEGADPASVGPREQAQQRAESQRRARLLYVQTRLGNTEFSKVSTAERLSIAFGAIGNNYMNTISNIQWPGFGGLARMLLDPRQHLHGVVSGLGMILTGGSNLFSAEQWRRDPLGNLLKSAADIATGLAIILGSITALAAVVAAIMGALMLITFGAAAPIALPVISVCTTIITTVGGWTIAVGKIALVLQALSLIKNLIDVATAQTADDLARESEEIQSDVEGGLTAAMSITGARGAQAGIRNLRGRVSGVMRAARRAGGARALARQTLRAAPRTIRTAGARALRRGRRRLVTMPRRVSRGVRALGRRVGAAPGRLLAGARALPGRIVAGGRRALATARAAPGRVVAGVRALPGRVARGARQTVREIRDFPKELAASFRRGRETSRRFRASTGAAAERRATDMSHGLGVDADMARIPPVNAETAEMLANNPTLHGALAANPRAASILRLCRSLCIPANATTTQIQRLERLFDDMADAGLNVSSSNIRLRNYFYRNRHRLDAAIDDLENGFRSSQISARSAVAQVNADDLVPERGFSTSQPSPVLRTGTGAVEKARSVLRGRLEAKGQVLSGPWEAHHVIPWELRTHGVFDIVRTARGGWDHNWPVNGIALPITQGGTSSVVTGGRTFHQSTRYMLRGHPVYNGRVNTRLNKLLDEYESLPRSLRNPQTLRRNVYLLIQELKADLESGRLKVLF